MAVSPIPDFTPTPPPVMEPPPTFFVSLVALLLRHGLTGIGTLLVGGGVISTSQQGSLIEYGVGFASIIAGLIWSAVEKQTKITTINTLMGEVK